MNIIAILILFILLLAGTSACGPKGGSYDSSCYQIHGDDVVYTCKGDNPDNPKANTGYTGPYNPKALDLYRPGRFENINSPVW